MASEIAKEAAERISNHLMDTSVLDPEVLAGMIDQAISEFQPPVAEDVERLSQICVKMHREFEPLNSVMYEFEYAAQMAAVLQRFLIARDAVKDAEIERLRVALGQIVAAYPERTGKLSEAYNIAKTALKGGSDATN